MIKSGIDEKKISILGSARYCKQWMEQNRQILPRIIPLNAENSNKLKIVFMTTKARYKVDVERMFKTFEFLSNQKEIEVWIKPHTRTVKAARLFQNLSLRDASDISSVELCEWADVVLVIGSSIILEPILQGKPALYLKYLHENITLYEELGACWIIHDEDELKAALSALRSDPKYVPYSAEGIEEFVSNIVYGGRGERDVLADYQQFIVNCADKVKA
jgi:hypothetical protein